MRFFIAAVKNNESPQQYKYSALWRGRTGYTERQKTRQERIKRLSKNTVLKKIFIALTRTKRLNFLVFAFNIGSQCCKDQDYPETCEH